MNNRGACVVAEIDGNHNGDVDLGRRMIRVAKECGADALKFKLYRRGDLWTEDHLKELNDGVAKLENVNGWETKELGLPDIFSQIDRFAVQGWDHKVSADPAELRIVCSAARRISDSIGDGIKRLSDDEIAKRKKFVRSIATARPLKAGQAIVYEDIALKRPGTGIPAGRFREIIGRHVNHNIEENKTLFWSYLVK